MTKTNGNYVRVISLAIRPDRVTEVEERLGEVADRLGSVPGLTAWTTAVDRESGSGVAVARYEDEASAEAAESTHRAILGDFGEYFAKPPRVELYEVIGSFGT